jgi:hypothetical protein
MHFSAAWRLKTHYSPLGWAQCRSSRNAVVRCLLQRLLGASGIEGTGHLNARSYLNFGMRTDQPKPGDVVVLSRRDTNGWEDHVGFSDETKARAFQAADRPDNSTAELSPVS